MFVVGETVVTGATVVSGATVVTGATVVSGATVVTGTTVVIGDALVVGSPSVPNILDDEYLLPNIPGDSEVPNHPEDLDLEKSGGVTSSSNMLPTNSAPALPSKSGIPYKAAIGSPLIYLCYISLSEIMLHLVEGVSPMIENNLIWVKSVRDTLFAWWFNAILLVCVVGSFTFFLYSNYGTGVPEELQKIPFQPRTWNNAVRNVPITEYGQIPQTEIRVGVQGFSNRSGGTAF
jgi:hypothetical protein